MLFDTHAHYDDEQFNDDRDALLAAMPENGVSLIVNAGSSLASSIKGLALADAYPFVYAAVGVHPHDAQDMDDGTVLELEKLLKHPKAVAVGEIGLDYHYDFSPRDIQKKRFREQLALAKQLKKPVIIHERESTADTLEILREHPEVRGVFHCYSGSWETAKILLDKGWYLSFTGVITYKNARKTHEVLTQMPRDRIMIETDCPYLAPVPMRGRRNSSLYLRHTAEKLAELLGISFGEAAALTMENGKRFFGV
jgi:TatD DNase family protein